MNRIEKPWGYELIIEKNDKLEKLQDLKIKERTLNNTILKSNKIKTNKKEEIENEIKQTLIKSNISNYFTFDWVVPSLMKALNKEIVCAFRLSEYEKDIFSQCDWVWVDSFQTIWFDAEYLASLKKLGLKVALVSPELHNRKREMEQVKEIVNSVKVDAICTDLPDFWYR